MMPAGVLLTLPLPVPAFVTVRVKVVMGQTVAGEAVEACGATLVAPTVAVVATPEMAVAVPVTPVAATVAVEVP
jgi:hypothetical protein